MREPGERRRTISCTVVIPVRNRRKQIGRAVESVLAQSFLDFELIVVDDGSTDGTAHEVSRRSDPRLRVTSLPPSGPGAARNVGLAQARSSWTAFLDSDDEWHKSFLEKTLAVARACPEVGAVFSNIFSAGKGRPLLVFPSSEAGVLDNYLAFAVANEGRGMTCSSTLVSTAALRRAGGFPEDVKRSEDIDAWLRLAISSKIGAVPEVLAIYHDEGWGPSRPRPEPHYPRAVTTMRTLTAQERVPEPFKDLLPRLEALYLLAHARDMVYYGDRAGARRVLFQECSWRHCPPRLLLRALARMIAG